MIVRCSASLLVLLLLLATGINVQPQAGKPSELNQPMPESNGAYCRQDGAGWTKLGHPTMADSKAHGLGNFIYTNGMTRLNVTLTYRGPQAALQIPNPKPTFLARGVGTAKEALIVQLTRKKDSRETKISSTEAAFDNKMGFTRGEIRRVTTSPVSKTAFTITPDEDLKPGEYLLVLGNEDAVFEFGIAFTHK